MPKTPLPGWKNRKVNAHIHKSFTKAYDRLDSKVQRSFKRRLLKFRNDPFQVELNNHPLKGRWQGYRSINISGDFRAIYKNVDTDRVVFVAIGSHSQLYK